MKRILITIALIIFMLFPSPFIISENYHRLQNPPIEPQAIDNTSSIPDKPQKIEAWVENNTEYQYDFKTYGTVWYILKPEQTLEKGKGDCKARAILLASIFEKKDIEYELHVSMFHWWVSYENKNGTWAEYRSTSLKEGDEWTMPDIGKTVDKMWSVKEDYYEMFWASMPNLRQLFLLTSLLYIWLPFRYYKKGLKTILKYRSHLQSNISRLRNSTLKKIKNIRKKGKSGFHNLLSK
ncbi:MAG: hypothetical protein ACLFVB_03880 [Thermoplasmata archaeon]